MMIYFLVGVGIVLLVTILLYLIEFILKWIKKHSLNQRSDCENRKLLKKINKNNKEYWKDHEIYYYTLPDGTKATGSKKLKDFINQQEPLPDDMNKILRDNLHKLYEE